jgi:hypothetical protein
MADNSEAFNNGKIPESTHICGEKSTACDKNFQLIHHTKSHTKSNQITPTTIDQTWHPKGK